MMFSYYSEYDLETGKTVADPDLNEILQDVRKLDDRIYVLERPVSYRRNWFSPVVTKTLYSLIVETNNPECQIINFCQDSGAGIHSYVSKAHVYNYLIVFFNGYNKNKQTVQTTFE